MSNDQSNLKLSSTSAKLSELFQAEAAHHFHCNTLHVRPVKPEVHFFSNCCTESHRAVFDLVRQSQKEELKVLGCDDISME